MKEITAKLNNYRSSPRKTRLVASLIKGKKVVDALAELNFLAKRASDPIAKLLKSAISNAKNDFNISDESGLKVKAVMVNAGPTLKRSMPRSRGMANRILKRTSCVTIVLSGQEKSKSKSKK